MSKWIRGKGYRSFSSNVANARLSVWPKQIVTFVKLKSTFSQTIYSSQPTKFGVDNDRTIDPERPRGDYLLFGHGAHKLLGDEFVEKVQLRIEYVDLLIHDNIDYAASHTCNLYVQKCSPRSGALRAFEQVC